MYTKIGAAPRTLPQTAQPQLYNRHTARTWRAGCSNGSGCCSRGILEAARAGKDRCPMAPARTCRCLGASYRHSLSAREQRQPGTDGTVIRRQFRQKRFGCPTAGQDVCNGWEGASWTYPSGSWRRRRAHKPHARNRATSWRGLMTSCAHRTFFVANEVRPRSGRRRRGRTEFGRMAGVERFLEGVLHDLVVANTCA
jgi:hypothetical protein